MPEKRKGKGKNKGKDKGDTSKSGYGKSSTGKDKSSNKSKPYGRPVYQCGLYLIPHGDGGNWYYNSDTGYRQFWSNIHINWIRGSWEDNRA